MAGVRVRFSAPNRCPLLAHCGRRPLSIGVALARALHQSLDDKPLILDDPIAPLMVDIAGEADARRVEAAVQPRSKQQRTIMVVRSRYAEDCLAEAAGRGARQYLVLGAGLDTFAYRQPPWAGALSIYEVDHPSTQRLKRARLDAAGIALPMNLVFVPIDFESDALGEVLRRAGFDWKASTFCSWLGVTMYLTDAATDETLATLRGLPPGSEVVLSFNLPSEAVPVADVERVRALIAAMAATDEP